MEFKPVKLTYVRYVKGDHLGKLLAYVSLLPIALVVATATWCVARRELLAAFFLAGILASEALNLSLKAFFAEARPKGSDREGVDYGMPSDHAQLSFFAASFFVLYICGRSHAHSAAWKAASSAAAIGVAAAVCWSRVYLLYHSVAQVLVGAAVGAAFGSAWFGLLHVVRPYFVQIERWRICEWLCVKDTSHIPNVLQFERHNCIQERKKLKK
eukprot:tig00001038_g6531.t1